MTILHLYLELILKKDYTLELINPIPVTYNQIPEVNSMDSSNKYAYTWDVFPNFNYHK